MMARLAAVGLVAQAVVHTVLLELVALVTVASAQSAGWVVVPVQSPVVARIHRLELVVQAQGVWGRMAAVTVRRVVAMALLARGDLGR
jgi:hypothetical protein